jgi:membrane protease YdiL (CAAX protease family)
MAGLILHPLLTLLLWRATPVGLQGAAYLALLLELLPVLAIAQLPLVDAEQPLPRIPVYLSSGAVILLVGFSGLAVGWSDPGPEAMGLTWPPWEGVLAWTLGLCAGALLLLWLFFLVRRAFGIRETPLLSQLLPRNREERGAFALLSLAAGFGEEIAYRGFLIPVLAVLVGSGWMAALLSSVAFGALHAYQGWLGIIRTACLGLLLAAGFIVSGTLWPAILAHAILDLLAGLVLGETLLRE